MKSMKKRIATRCLLGAPIGLAISTLITIFISLTVGDGRYYPVVPELATDFGTELNAVLAQAVFSLLYGAAWGGASVIWEQEGWSILRQSAAHLAVCSLATFPIAYFMRWMQHTPSGFLLYFGIFLCVYAVLWLSLYGAMKKRIRQINERMRDKGPGQA